MNILPHKSWHVYNKKNIERVRKDEAEARKEQEAKDKRSLLADSEARLQLLRKKATSSQDIEPVRLFAEAEEAAKQNEEVLAEEKAKKESKERQFTMYLDKGAKDDDAPWYAKRERSLYTDDHISKPYIKSRHDKDVQKRRKRPAITLEDDPLSIVKSHLDKQHHQHHRRPEQQQPKQDKKRKRSKTLSIEELRAQRLEREKMERAKVKSVIYGDDIPTLDPKKQQYNSQYNRDETHQAQRLKRQRYT